MKKIVVIILAVGVIFGAYLQLSPQANRPDFLANDFERFCRSCEQVLKKRLKSPSSYVRLECTGPYTEQANENNYFFHDQGTAWNEVGEWTKKRIERGELFISTAYLDYEASNSFGAPIHGLASCTIEHSEGVALKKAVGVLGPNVNGYSDTGWVLSQLQNSTSN